MAENRDLGTEEPVTPTVTWLVTTHSGDNVLRYDADGAFIDEFVPARSGRLRNARDLTYGPDGHLHVVNAHESRSDVLRFHGEDGSFLERFAHGNGLDHPYSLAFGPPGGPAEGYLFVASQDDAKVSRFDAASGAHAGIFVHAGSGGLQQPRQIRFGPDGHLYVANRDGNAINRYHAQSGAFIDHFVAPHSGGLKKPIQFAWGPDGTLYAGSEDTNQLLRFNGSTGAFIDVFIDGNVPTGGGLRKPSGLAWGPLDGNLYVASRHTGTILRYDGAGRFRGVFIDRAPDADGVLKPLELPEFIQPRVKHR